MKQFLEYILFEARSHSELNKKVGLIEQLEPYHNDENYFITFTDINKVGINPKNVYGTPIGIYCYPLKEMWKDLIEDDIPFASERKYCSLLHYTSGKILDASATEADVKEAIKTLKKEFPELEKIKNFNDFFVYNKDDEEDEFDDYEDEFDDRKVKATTPFHKIWYLTMNVTQQIFGNTKRKDMNGITVKWNVVLRKLGYAGAVDRKNGKGEGVIHPNEPLQAVFFNRSAFKVIGTFDNVMRKELSTSKKNEIENNKENSRVYPVIKSLLSSYGILTGNFKLSKIGKRNTKPYSYSEKKGKLVLSDFKFNDLSLDGNKTIFMNNCNFINCDIKNCDLIGYPEHFFEKTTMTNCNLDAKNKIISIYKDVSFINCNIENIKRIEIDTYTGLSTIKNTTFTGAGASDVLVKINYIPFNKIKSDDFVKLTSLSKTNNIQICLNTKKNFNLQDIFGKTQPTEKQMTKLFDYLSVSNVRTITLDGISKAVEV